MYRLIGLVIFYSIMDPREVDMHYLGKLVVDDNLNYHRDGIMCDYHYDRYDFDGVPLPPI